MAVLKDDEVDRLERANVATTGSLLAWHTDLYTCVDCSRRCNDLCMGVCSPRKQRLMTVGYAAVMCTSQIGHSLHLALSPWQCRAGKLSHHNRDCLSDTDKSSG